MALTDGWVPLQTPFVFAPAIEPDLAPLPTARHSQSSPQKRQLIDQTSLTSVCGYIGGNESSPVTCASGAYCGFQTALNVLGCCASFHTTSSTQVVLDSCNYHIACVDADDVSEGGCDDACMSNDVILKCTGSASWCNTYSYSHWGINSYACGDLDFFHIETSFTSSGQILTTTPPPWVTGTYTGLPFETVGAEPTTLRVAAPPVLQNESELGPYVGEITATVVGATFGAVLILMLALLLCLRKRTKPPGAVRFITNQDVYGRQLEPTASDRLVPHYVDDETRS
ncbi:hypothetical protein F5Y19DRAFT_331587 [Xylariaceae sp. FL1651]|nr:hypothetical protein F5Y19DRAFT_331587 [Xylariaceae sp. FL1651]